MSSAHTITQRVTGGLVDIFVSPFLRQVSVIRADFK
jgi:hypothetical protein